MSLNLGNGNVTFGDGTIQSTTYTPRTIKKIMKGFADFHALTSDNKIYGWGYNSHGGVGDGTTTNTIVTEILFPETGAISDMCSINNSKYVLFANGNLYAWGYNGYGQLGFGDVTARYFPTLTLTGVSQLYYPDNHRDYTGDNAPEISIHIKKTDGTFWCCGHNGHGELANGTTTNSSVWIALTPPTSKTISTIWKGSNTGTSLFCRTTDNLIYSIGYNTQGQLGIGNVTQQNSWAQVAYFNATVGADIVDIQTGSYYYAPPSGGEHHWTAVFTASGNIYTCGNNAYGQLGDGTLTTRSTFAQVSLTKPVKKMIRGYNCIYVIFTDNLYARWGSNEYGQLGNGTTTTSSTPIYSAAGDTALDVFICSRSGAYGPWCEVFIKKSLGIYVCGYNGNGTMGTGITTGNVSTQTLIYINENPVDLVDVLITGFSTVTSCLFFSNSNEVFVCGQNVESELGVMPNFGEKYTFRSLSFP